MPVATRQEWLEWFYDNVDLGPAHEKILEMMRKEFSDETGKEAPCE